MGQTQSLASLQSGGEPAAAKANASASTGQQQPPSLVSDMGLFGEEEEMDDELREALRISAEEARLAQGGEATTAETTPEPSLGDTPAPTTTTSTTTDGASEGEGGGEANAEAGTEPGADAAAAAADKSTPPAPKVPTLEEQLPAHVALLLDLLNPSTVTDFLTKTDPKGLQSAASSGGSDSDSTALPAAAEEAFGTNEATDKNSLKYQSGRMVWWRNLQMQSPIRDWTAAGVSKRTEQSVVHLSNLANVDSTLHNKTIQKRVRVLQLIYESLNKSDDAETKRTFVSLSEASRTAQAALGVDAGNVNIGLEMSLSATMKLFVTQLKYSARSNPELCADVIDIFLETLQKLPPLALSEREVASTDEGKAYYRVLSAGYDFVADFLLGIVNAPTAPAAVDAAAFEVLRQKALEALLGLAFASGSLSSFLVTIRILLGLVEAKAAGKTAIDGLKVGFWLKQLPNCRSQFATAEVVSSPICGDLIKDYKFPEDVDTPIAPLQVVAFMLNHLSSLAATVFNFEGKPESASLRIKKQVTLPFILQLQPTTFSTLYHIIAGAEAAVRSAHSTEEKEQEKGKEKVSTEQDKLHEDVLSTGITLLRINLMNLATNRVKAEDVGLAFPKDGADGSLPGKISHLLRSIINDPKASLIFSNEVSSDSCRALAVALDYFVPEPADQAELLLRGCQDKATVGVSKARGEFLDQLLVRYQDFTALSHLLADAPVQEKEGEDKTAHTKTIPPTFLVDLLRALAEISKAEFKQIIDKNLLQPNGDEIVPPKVCPPYVQFFLALQNNTFGAVSVTASKNEAEAADSAAAPKPKSEKQLQTEHANTQRLRQYLSVALEHLSELLGIFVEAVRTFCAAAKAAEAGGEDSKMRKNIELVRLSNAIGWISKASVVSVLPALVSSLLFVNPYDVTSTTASSSKGKEKTESDAHSAESASQLLTSVRDMLALVAKVHNQLLTEGYHLLFGKEATKQYMTIVETLHPYENNTSITIKVNHPGAEVTAVEFDPQCATEETHDYLYFFQKPDHNEMFQDKFTGGPHKYPKVPIVIPVSTLWMHFYSDGSNVAWGFKCTLTSEVTLRSWIAELERTMLWFNARVAINMLGTIDPSEKECANWLSSSVLKLGRETTAETAEQAFLGDLVEQRNEGGKLHSKMTPNNLARSASPFAAIKSPGLETAVRAVVAALLKHTGLTPLAVSNADTRSASMPAQLKKAYRYAHRVKRALIRIRQTQAMESETAQQSYEEIAEPVINRAKFLLEFVPANQTVLAKKAQQSSISTPLSLKRSVDKLILELKPDQPAPAKKPADDDDADVKWDGPDAVVWPWETTAKTILDFVLSNVKLDAINKAITVRKERAVSRESGLSFMRQLLLASPIAVLPDTFNLLGSALKGYTLAKAFLPNFQPSAKKAAPKPKSLIALRHYSDDILGCNQELQTKLAQSVYPLLSDMLSLKSDIVSRHTVAANVALLSALAIRCQTESDFEFLKSVDIFKWLEPLLFNDVWANIPASAQKPAESEATPNKKGKRDFVKRRLYLVPEGQTHQIPAINDPDALTDKDAESTADTAETPQDAENELRVLLKNQRRAAWELYQLFALQCLLPLSSSAKTDNEHDEDGEEPSKEPQLSETQKLLLAGVLNTLQDALSKPISFAAGVVEVQGGEDENDIVVTHADILTFLNTIASAPVISSKLVEPAWINTLLKLAHVDEEPSTESPTKLVTKSEHRGVLIFVRAATARLLGLVIQTLPPSDTNGQHVVQYFLSQIGSDVATLQMLIGNKAEKLQRRKDKGKERAEGAPDAAATPTDDADDPRGKLFGAQILRPFLLTALQDLSKSQKYGSLWQTYLNEWALTVVKDRLPRVVSDLAVSNPIEAESSEGLSELLSQLSDSMTLLMLAGGYSQPPVPGVVVTKAGNKVGCVAGLKKRDKPVLVIANEDSTWDYQIVPDSTAVVQQYALSYKDNVVTLVADQLLNFVQLAQNPKFTSSLLLSQLLRMTLKSVYNALSTPSVYRHIINNSALLKALVHFATEDYPDVTSAKSITALEARLSSIELQLFDTLPTGAPEDEAVKEPTKPTPMTAAVENVMWTVDIAEAGIQTEPPINASRAGTAQITRALCQRYALAALETLLSDLKTVLLSSNTTSATAPEDDRRAGLNNLWTIISEPTTLAKLSRGVAVGSANAPDNDLKELLSTLIANAGKNADSAKTPAVQGDSAKPAEHSAEHTLNGILALASSELSSTQGSGKFVTHLEESLHPYENSMDYEKLIELPGVSSVFILFDPETYTENNCDWLRFKEYPSRNLIKQMCGDLNNFANFAIPANKFYINFTSDASCTYWGYKFLAIGIQPPAPGEPIDTTETALALLEQVLYTAGSSSVKSLGFNDALLGGVLASAKSSMSTVVKLRAIHLLADFLNPALWKLYNDKPSVQALGTFALDTVLRIRKGKESNLIMPQTLQALVELVLALLRLQDQQDGTQPLACKGLDGGPSGLAFEKSKDVVLYSPPLAYQESGWTAALWYRLPLRAVKTRNTLIEFGNKDKICIQTVEEETSIGLYQAEGDKFHSSGVPVPETVKRNSSRNDAGEPKQEANWHFLWIVATPGKGIRLLDQGEETISYYPNSPIVAFGNSVEGNEEFGVTDAFSLTAGVEDAEARFEANQKKGRLRRRRSGFIPTLDQMLVENATIEDNNVLKASGGAVTVAPPVFVNDGSWSYEVTLVTAGTVWIGWRIHGDLAAAGESEKSFAYNGSTTGPSKKTNRDVNSYGKRWKAGDVVTACFLYEAGNLTLSYTLNGEDMETAFNGSHENPQFGPVITLERGQKVKLNFGAEPFAFPRARSEPLDVSKLLSPPELKIQENRLQTPSWINCLKEMHDLMAIFFHRTALPREFLEEVLGDKEFLAFHPDKDINRDQVYLDQLKLSNTLWTRKMDEELVAVINTIGTERDLDPLDMSADEIRLSDTMKLQYPDLTRLDYASIAARFYILRSLNRRFATFNAYVDVARMQQDGTITPSNVNNARSMAGYMLTLRRLMFMSVKREYVRKICQEKNTNREMPLFRFNRAKAIRSAATPSSRGADTLMAAFAQQMTAVNPEAFRQSDRGWRVEFVGEGATDAGGPYRESMAHINGELYDSSLPLLIKTPNGRVGVGSHREKYIPNPSLTSAQWINMYKSLGIIIAICIRTRNVYDVRFPSYIWRRIIGEEQFGIEDLESFDVITAGLIREIEAFTDPITWGYSYEDLTFTTVLSDGSKIELKRGGSTELVTFDKRHEYTRLLLQARLNEAKPSIDALRAGMAYACPMATLQLLTWPEMEALVCGRADYTVEELQSRTSFYSPLSLTAPPIQLLFTVLKEATPEERGNFLRFVYGQSRLPPNENDSAPRLNIEQMDTSGRSADLMFPKAATCSFKLYWPAYTNKEACRAKLIYAITNCLAIDSDFTPSSNWDEVDLAEPDAALPTDEGEALSAEF
eukprot:TRINITY_DN893_c0_g1_i8.p1 TRINITY_DN893_c0_g1~~TRINITY_DN893_c0_g1_i8.p1  ORF type:complete len:3452 (+),score=650.24 TRINITY_DN893_c0_g1_i8:154-10509(+)